MYYKMTIELPDDKEDSTTCFNHVRLALEKCKEAHSKTLKDNHGFSLKYLRKLLTPVGINIPTGPELDSLQKLADARGTFAHSRGKSAQYGEYKKATKVLPPEEAAQIVIDCLSICRKIKEQAAAAMA